MVAGVMCPDNRNMGKSHCGLRREMRRPRFSRCPHSPYTDGEFYVPRYFVGLSYEFSYYVLGSFYSRR